MKKEEKIMCNYRIDPKLREKFRIKTIKNQTTMTDVIVKAIEKYVEEEKK